VTSTFDDGAPSWRRGAKVTVRFYSSTLIRGIGENSQSQAHLGAAGRHRVSRDGNAITGTVEAAKSEADGYTLFFTVAQAQDATVALFHVTPSNERRA